MPTDRQTDRQIQRFFPIEIRKYINSFLKSARTASTFHPRVNFQTFGGTLHNSVEIHISEHLLRESPTQITI
jgi:hypothetical protein